MKQVSDLKTAQEAISGFQLDDFSESKVTMHKSTVSAMKNGATFARKIYKGANRLNKKVTHVSKAIPAYAKKIEKQDKQDAKKLLLKK